MIRTLIVEDEPLAIDRLRFALALHEDIEVIGACQDGLNALAEINRLRPSLIFLDVHLPGLSGLEVLHRAQMAPPVIFTTAHDEYAINAFEWGAFDYLMKPFDNERVAVALERFRQRSGVPEPEPQILERLHATEGSGPLQRFFVRHRGVAVPITTADIIAITAEGDYCRVHLLVHSHLVHLPLREFKRRLDPARFRRVHRSAIVNTDHVLKIENIGRTATLSLSGDLAVTASRAGVAQLRDLHL